MLVSRVENSYNNSVMEKVIVTGGAGFIGSHLAEQLARLDYQVTIIDDLSTGRKENIEGLLGDGHAELIQGSITDLALLQRVFQGASYVFHMAALARVPQSVDDPVTTNEINVGGTLNVLLAAKDNGLKKVIYTSSSAVYGNTLASPQSEDTPPEPISPYALTKLVGEQYADIFKQIYGLDTVSLRYFNAFGPRQDPLSPYANAFPVFIRRISQGLPPIIFGDGEQTRDFVYVDDIVRANILAVKPGIEGVYNIGSGVAVTVNKLVATILEIMQKDIKPVYEAPRLGDALHTLADIRKAEQFGFKPEISLEEGLKAIIPGYSFPPDGD